MIKYIYILLSILIFLSCNTKKNTTIKDSEPLFTQLSKEETGITFKNKIKEDYYNFFGVFNYAYNGAGVAIGDINNDGLADIYFVGNQFADKLYLNKGNFNFEDITVKSGIKPKKAWHSGVTMVDINSDGLLDIYVTAGGWNEAKDKRANLLYVNQGNNTFKEMANIYGIADTGFSIMASFFDMDKDNDLDLYLTNRPKDFFLSPEQVLDGKKNSPAYSNDKLYKNDNGKYVDVSQINGISNTFGYGLGLSTSDFDKDGDTDIYVGNDFFENDYLFKNNGKGMFNEEIRNFSNHVSYYTMGVDVVDINNDGFEDVFTLDMYPEDYVRSKTTMAPMNIKRYNSLMGQGFYNQYMHNVLNISNGNGFFSDISQLSGVNGTDWSWACLGADFDNDGDNDFFVTNGYRRDLWDRDANEKRQLYTLKPIDESKTPNQIIKEIVDLYPSVKLQNFMFENGGRLKFKNNAEKWGLNALSFSNGAAFGDLDNDGDLDLVVNNIDDAAFVYQNNSEKITNNNFLKISLKGPDKNLIGIGAKITVFHGDSIQYKDFKTVRGYLSSVQPKVHFGLGTITTIDSMQIQWPDGKQQTLNNIQANTQIDIVYKNAIQPSIASHKSLEKQLLKDNSAAAFGKPVTHVENEYNDFEDQVLLPHKLSTYGPAITAGDINGDGLDDIYIGGATNQTAQLYIQSKNNTFRKKKQESFSNDKYQEDVFADFIDIDNDKDLDLYVVSGGNEYEPNHEFYQDRLYLNNGNGVFTKSLGLPNITSSGSCVIPIDFDMDGDMDLFVGSRHIPRKYPSPPSHFLLENNQGVYSDVTDTKAREFRNLGMVTAAISRNIDSDKNEELIVVGEWMKIHVFKWKDGSYKEINEAVGLDNTYGWWNAIEADDIDNDGDIDFVVGNLGLNYKFKASTDKPFYVFADDYDKNGTQDVFLAKELDNKLVPIRGKECATEQLPYLKSKFTSYDQFANASLKDIIGEQENSAIKYKAELFESVILWNDNGVFRLKSLPIEAQFSVINGIVIDDFNKDGQKDILLGGNRFEVEIETTRSDASVGLLLLGTEETGIFKALKPSQSGFFIPGNVKNLEQIKLDDNKNGVLVAINNGNLKLYSSPETFK